MLAGTATRHDYWTSTWTQIKVLNCYDVEIAAARLVRSLFPQDVSANNRENVKKLTKERTS